MIESKAPALDPASALREGRATYTTADPTPPSPSTTLPAAHSDRAPPTAGTDGPSPRVPSAGVAPPADSKPTGPQAGERGNEGHPEIVRHAAAAFNARVTGVVRKKRGP